MTSEATPVSPVPPELRVPGQTSAHSPVLPLGPLRRTVRETGLGLITLGVIVFLFVAYQLFGTNFAEEHSQSLLERSFQAQVARAATTTVPAGRKSSGAGAKTRSTGGGGADNPTLGRAGASVNPSVPTGAAVDHLVIPAIGVDKFVVQGTAEAQLSQGPGHYPATVMPGQIGNAGIAGHRTTYGAPFFQLDKLKAGDPIYVTDTTGTRYTYTMASSEVVAPTDGAVLDPTTTAQLTLTTCNPRFSDTSRLVVIAVLTATVAPTKVAASSPASSAPTAKPTASTTVPATSRPTAHQVTVTTNLGVGNDSALPPALAYGAGVVVLWILVRLGVNRTRRWRRAGVLALGLGLCLIPLWFCFENVVRVLPSSL